MSNLVEFVDGDMTEEDRKKIDELLIKIDEENKLPEKTGKLEEENARLREALKIYKEALHEGLWQTGLQDSIWEIIEQAEEKAEQILKGNENV